MRLIFGGFIVGRTKEEEKENAEEKLEWAIAHFQHQVATQQVVSRHRWLGVRRACRHDQTAACGTVHDSASPRPRHGR